LETALTEYRLVRAVRVAFDPLPRLCQHHAGGFQAGDGGPHGS
jgi:hypothetical protein